MEKLRGRKMVWTIQVLVVALCFSFLIVNATDLDICRDGASFSRPEIFPSRYRMSEIEWSSNDVNTLFIQYMTPEIYEYGSISIAHTSLFVEQKGYYLHLYTKDDLKTIPSLLSPATETEKKVDIVESDERWNKILLLYHSIHRLLSLSPNDEERQQQYVVWMDTDIIINDWSFRIEQYTESFPYAQLIISKEFLNEHGLVNSGFIIMKVSSYALQLLEHWYTSMDRSSISDQHAFSTLYETNVLNIHENSVILTANALNNRFPVWQYLQKGDKLIHLAGVHDIVRVNVFKEAMKRTCDSWMLASIDMDMDDTKKQKMFNKSEQILDKASLQSILRSTQQQLARQAVDVISATTDVDTDDEMIRQARDLIQKSIQLGYARPREYKDDKDMYTDEDIAHHHEEMDVCLVSSVLLRALEVLSNQTINNDDTLMVIAQLQTRVDLSFEYLENSGYFTYEVVHALSLRDHCVTSENKDGDNNTNNNSQLFASSLLFDNTVVSSVPLQILAQIRQSIITMCNSLHLLVQLNANHMMDIDITGPSSGPSGSDDDRKAKDKVSRHLLFYVFKYYSAVSALLERIHIPTPCTSSNSHNNNNNHNESGIVFRTVNTADMEHLRNMKIASLESALRHLCALDRIDGGDGMLMHCHEDIREESSSTLAVLAALLCNDDKAVVNHKPDNMHDDEKHEKCWLSVYQKAELWSLLDEDMTLSDMLKRLWVVNTTLPAAMSEDIALHDLSATGTVCEYSTNGDASNDNNANDNGNRNRCKEVIRGRKLATHGALLLKSVWSQRVAPLHIMHMFDSLNRMAHQCRIEI